MKSGTIIMIDDNRAELRLCEEALKIIRVKNEILLFENPETAFDYISHYSQKLFLIISDLNMPGLTGMELLEKINDDYELKMQAIPFIFLSNAANELEIEHAYSLSAQGYFLKPSTLDGLVEIFKSIVTYWSLAKIPRAILHE